MNRRTLFKTSAALGATLPWVRGAHAAQANASDVSDAPSTDTDVLVLGGGFAGLVSAQMDSIFCPILSAGGNTVFPARGAQEAVFA